jgi:predicted AlkP superfamily pyrophosphatase or phosphodiesterase
MPLDSSTLTKSSNTHLLVILLLLGLAPPVSGELSASVSNSHSTLILLSMDGFRWDYVDLTETPHLDRIAERGVRAKSLIPVFPAQTFPNHYSIVTGLYPQNHGLASNTMYDPFFDAIFRHRDAVEARNPRWWQGEPIWLTARSQGLKTACYFWIGCSVPINGLQPDIVKDFDRSIEIETSIDTALSWLDGPPEQRPRLIVIYTNEPNRTGHIFGSTATETLAAARRADALVGRLWQGLERLGQAKSTDLVVVSDHGMTDLSPNRFIALEDHIDLEQVAFVSGGTFLQIQAVAGKEKTILKALKKASPHLKVYRKEGLPKRFHYSKSRRIAPIVGILDNGWLIGRRAARSRLEVGKLKGGHGFDHEHPDMHGIFFAAGPSFKSGLNIKSFSAVHIYEMLAAVLSIDASPNDGNPEVLRMLRK